MGWLTEKLRERAKTSPKKVVFPEYNDERVAEAVKIIEREKIACPVVLSPGSLNKDKVEHFAKIYCEIRPNQFRSLKEAQQIMSQPLYYSAMMARLGEVDAFVAGAEFSTSSVIRAGLRCLEIDPVYNLVSGCFVMEVPESSYGEKGVFVYSDCAVIPSPTSEQLATIALSAGEFTKEVLEIEPRLAFLSFSTKGSSKAVEVEKVREAVAILAGKNPPFLFDGELQVDSALEPEVAKRKVPHSSVAGRANVLIFPNLDAGNISYKLTERLAKAKALGPVLLGFKQICSDLSRGVSVEDIVDITALTVVRVQKASEEKTL
ncbi:MAG TPA: phosphate acetyltransferase [Candidatus Omnitrophica bacterium]|nr:MAG: phosphate acetyltransferase [Candidatus Omnitrophota bacterium]HEC68710.1 phosphate acetyltransferase [Candidatus Omnitrophota bacterium]